METAKTQPTSRRLTLPSNEPEKFYNGQLRQLIRMMANSVDEIITPVLRRNYTADSLLTDMLLAAIRQARERFFTTAFGQQMRRLSQTVVSRAESESSAAFVAQINRFAGIDMSALMSQGGLGNYVDAAVESNVALIRSLSADYFDDIQREVMDSVMRGDSLTTLTRNLQSTTGATYKRAHLIARDQMGKITSDITERRQTGAGITRFRWSTSQDVRVSGNPAGKYPKAAIKCFVIARTDIGYGPGVYLWSRGAKYGGESGLLPGRAHIGCRCHAISQIEGLDY